MALLQKYSDDTCLWGIWKVEENFEDLSRLLQGTMLCEEADRRFSSPHRKLEWLAVRVLLHTLLGEHKEIVYLPTGKPCLADASWHISISHTRGYVAVILGKQLVGIDIEQYGERVQRIATRFMGDDEIASYYLGTTTWNLLLHWSAKETIFKCMDVEGVDFRKHLHIYPFEMRSAAGEFTACETKTEDSRQYLIRYLLHPDFVMTYHADK